MGIVAIVANGPSSHIPNLQAYTNEVDVWIGADRGAFLLAAQEITVDYAVGDFDSVTDREKKEMSAYIQEIVTFPSMKNETDLELAIEKAYTLHPDKIYLFGVTGGRLDHGLANIQLLQPMLERGMKGIIIDRWNRLELTKPGKYDIAREAAYPYVSFIPFSETVKNISLTHFLYELEGWTIHRGSTRCISNELVEKNGILSYDEGRLLIIKSKDVN